jgi:hypothetical protein
MIHFDPQNEPYKKYAQLWCKWSCEGGNGLKEHSSEKLRIFRKIYNGLI